MLKDWMVGASRIATRVSGWPREEMEVELKAVKEIS